MRTGVEGVYQARRLGWAVCAIEMMVVTLIERGNAADLAEAQLWIDRLENWPTTEPSAIREITLLGLRSVLARAGGDRASYRDFASRYRAMAECLGFEGHLARAEAMIG